MAQKILVVEDDPVFRNYLHQVLKYDFDVMAVPGPLEALEALKNDKFPLMITDLRMPDMDGRELVDKVHREIDPNIMVIVITAFEDDWPIDEAMLSEVFRYLRKGAFLPSELKQNVSKALEMRGSLVSLEEYKKRSDISEALYKDIFDKSTDAFFITDIELRPVALNEYFVELTGYDLDDLKEKTLLDIIDESERPYAAEAFNTQVAGGSPASVKIHLLRKDGSRKYVKVWARLVREVREISNAMFCIAREINDDGGEKVLGDGGSALEDLHSGHEERNGKAESPERQFQRLADHAKDIVIWLGRDFTCEYVNREVQRLLGYTPDELLGKKIPWDEIVHPDDYHIVERWQEASRDKVAHMEGEFRLYARSRHMLFLSYRVSLQYDNGVFSGLDIIAEDITQQKIAEQELRKANRKIQEFSTLLTNGVSKRIKALRESEERYKQIVEDSNDIIFSIDTEARLVYMNQKGLTTLHATYEDIFMRPCREFLADESSEKKLQDMIETIGKGKNPEQFDISIETHEGRKIYRTNLVQIGDSSRVEYVCIAGDISEEIAKNKKLQLLANIEHYSADAIIGLDTDRNIISWNHGACMMFGWSEEESIGKTAFLIVPDEGKDEAEEILAEVVEKGLVKDRETQRKTKDGRILDVMLTLTALKDAAKKTFGFSAIIKDLTEKKKMEAALIQSERLAAMGKLSASIAHEINNPLYGIRSCLNHVLNAKDGIDYQFVKLAVKETDRIADLIRNMKTFYMPLEGGVQKIDIAEMLQDIFILNRKYLEEHMVALKFSPDGTYFAECVPDQIKQVFINIITNAVEAMPGGGELKVRVEKSVDNGTIGISFQDTGVGIASSDLPQIFEMFYSKKPKVKGVGLGLSVSYGIMKRHGGSIEVQSEEGHGATFKVTLPIKTLWARQMHLDLK